MRHFQSWIRSYLELVNETEPHIRFHTWTAITIIAALLGRKCSVTFGPETYYPNLYVILTGPAGVRKGSAIKYGTQLITDIKGVFAAPDAVTRQQFIVELKQAEDSIMLGGKPLVHSSLFVIADELVVFLQDKDNQRLGDLCKLYDCPPDFSYKTKGAGQFTVINPMVWLLGATTPDWIATSMPQLAVGGGMTSRTIFVVAMTKGKHISLTEMPPFDEDLKAKLREDLLQIRKLAGPFHVSDGAKAFFNKWYYEVAPNLDLHDLRFGSYLDRLPAMICKVAMVISASRGDSMIVQQADLAASIHLFNDLHTTMTKAFGGYGMNVLGPQTEMVRDIIQAHIRVTRSEVLRKLHMHIASYDLDKILVHLSRERFCTFHTLSNDQLIILTQEQGEENKDGEQREREEGEGSGERGEPDSNSNPDKRSTTSAQTTQPTGTDPEN